MALCTVPLGIANGNIYTDHQPTLAEVADTNLSKWVCRFGPTTEQRVHYHLLLPPTVLAGSALTVRVLWRANAVTGDCVWKAYAKCNSLPQALNNAASSSATSTTTTDGTAFDLNVTEITFTPTNFGASTSMSVTIARDAAAGGDTLAVDAEVEEIELEWSQDASIAKSWLWVPASAMVIPSGSGVTRGQAASPTDNGGICRPRVLQFGDAADRYSDFRFSLPSNFAGALTTYLVEATLTGSVGTTSGWQIAMGRSGVGATRDPALTAQSTWTLSAANTGHISADSGHAAIVAPGAGDDVLCRLQRDSSDTSTTSHDVYGVLLVFDIIARSPAVIRLDPGSAALPTGAAAISQVADTNSSKVVARFVDGADQSVDLLRALPSTYSSGGSLRLRWSVASATLGYAYFRVDVGSPAPGSASDPALSVGTPFQALNAGNGLINEYVVDISSGLAASDAVHVRITRLASNANDTLDGLTVDLLDVTLEIVPAA